MIKPGGGIGDYSTFSRIINGEIPAVFESNEKDSPLVCFHNRLNWERVMLLVVPKKFMKQEQLWTNDILIEAMNLAIKVGIDHCPDGFRILSNFGTASHQSQLHAHIHVVSGIAKNLFLSTVNKKIEKHQNIEIREARVQGVKQSKVYWSSNARSQFEFLTTECVLAVAKKAVSNAAIMFPKGFRLQANYSKEVDKQTKGLYLLGGGQLDLYV